jgi:hypothetical protein
MANSETLEKKSQAMRDKINQSKENRKIFQEATKNGGDLMMNSPEVAAINDKINSLKITVDAVKGTVAELGGGLNAVNETVVELGGGLNAVNETVVELGNGLNAVNGTATDALSKVGAVNEAVSDLGIVLNAVNLTANNAFELADIVEGGLSYVEALLYKANSSNAKTNTNNADVSETTGADADIPYGKIIDSVTGDVIDCHRMQVCEEGEKLEKFTNDYDDQLCCYDYIKATGECLQVTCNDFEDNS